MYAFIVEITKGYDGITVGGTYDAAPDVKPGLLPLSRLGWFTPPAFIQGSSSRVLEGRSRSAVMDGDGGGSSGGGPGGIVSPDLGRPPSQASCRSRANADLNADVSPRWRDRISGGRVFGSGSVARSGSESGTAVPTAVESEPASGVIVDVIVVHGSDPVPEGYCKLVRSAGGKRADLNGGSMGQHVFLAVSRERCCVGLCTCCWVEGQRGVVFIWFCT